MNTRIGFATLAALTITACGAEQLDLRKGGSGLDEASGEALGLTFDDSVAAPTDFHVTIVTAKACYEQSLAWWSPDTWSKGKNKLVGCAVLEWQENPLASYHRAVHGTDNWTNEPVISGGRYVRPITTSMIDACKNGASYQHSAYACIGTSCSRPVGPVWIRYCELDFRSGLPQEFRP